MPIGPWSGQQLHPQTPFAQTSGRQTPLLQDCPQPQAGEQVFCGQTPLAQAAPLAQPHTPPHPLLAPQVPSCGQLGLQHVPWYATVPPGQGQMPPQLFDLPLSEPSGGQIGWQQAPL